MTTSGIFGDDEPEDAWHPDDTPLEQVANLVRRARLLDRWATVIPEGDDPHLTLDVLADIVRRARRRHLGRRERVRADQLDEDIDFVRGRI